MKTEYKITIIILICLSSISISYVSPHIFLIFHLDKYETNDVCNVLGGEWDWYYDLCNLPLDSKDKEYCEDVGGIPECAKTCWAELEWNPWKLLHGGCLAICNPACILDENIQVQTVSNTTLDSTYDKSLTIKFSPLNLENVELSFEWCTQNNGFWNDIDSTCYFENQKDLDAGMIAVQQYGKKIFGDAGNEN